MTDPASAQLRADGYAGWPDAVPRDRIDRALTAIHRHIGEHGLHPDRRLEFENASYCPELRDDPDILNLFGGTRLEVEATRRLGPLEPVSRAQIALRFPRGGGPARPTTARAVKPPLAAGPPWPDRDAMNPPHLDGVSAPHNGVPQGTIKTFSALAGVYLSDVGPGQGAFTVWPGSHAAHAAYFAEHGPESLLDGMPAIPEVPPAPVVGGPGYGFLAHYLLAHAIGPHHGPGIRYAVFFRLRARGHAERGRRTMIDPWLEWTL